MELSSQDRLLADSDFDHLVGCGEDELNDSQCAYYNKRSSLISELLDIVESCHNVANSYSFEVNQLSTTLRTVSPSPARTPGIKPVDINVLLEHGALQGTSRSPPNALPSASLPSTDLLHGSGINATSISQALFDPNAPVNQMPVHPVVTTSNLSAGDFVQTAGSTSPAAVRFAVPSQPTSYPSVSYKVGSSYYVAKKAVHPMACNTIHPAPSRIDGNKTADPPLTISSAPPITVNTTVVSSNLPTPPVRAVHSLPQQPVNILHTTLLHPRMHRPNLMKNGLPVRMSNPKNLTQAVNIRHAPASIPSLPPHVEERPVITYGPANNASSSRVPVQPRPIPATNVPPSSNSSATNVGRSLPLLPCTLDLDQRPGRDGIALDPSVAFVDLTNETPAQGLSQNSNKKNGVPDSVGDKKIFPSLVVVARPTLNKYSASTSFTQRQVFDGEMRKMLACPVGSFTKKLFQLGLLLSEQHCAHNLPMKRREPPLWVSKCCPHKSVFANSLFEATSLSPVVVIKLMYHWSCNANVQNVVFWVKVDNLLVKTYYTNFRAVCTAVAQEKIGVLGGLRKRIQIGVISLGTASDDGGSEELKEVKFDILAAMDEKNKRIRLKALNNSEIQKHWDDETIYKYKFRRIAENLKKLVHPDSVIILDFKVDNEIFHEYGFDNVILTRENVSGHNNTAIMDYLKKSIPQMFQSTLSLLSINIVQQFLDELAWREVYGPIPSLAYENLVVHIAEIMKLPGPSILTKLRMIAQNPFDDWTYSVWSTKYRSMGIVSEPSVITNASSAPKAYGNENTAKRQANLQTSAATTCNQGTQSSKPELLVANSSTNARRNSSSSYKISLELYYYGFVKGSSTLKLADEKFSVQCAFCGVLSNSSGSLTEHLIAHALNVRYGPFLISPMKKICWHCFEEVTNMKAHIYDKHPNPRITLTMCKICCIDLENNDSLIDHMKQTHVELDMPYFCNICHFRTSVYEEIRLHFKNQHDKDPYVICPYCQKAVRISGFSSLRERSQQNYFVQHVQKHRIEILNKKCEKCLLSFTNHDCLKEHQENYHVSGKGINNVTRYRIGQFTAVMMDRPTEPPQPPFTVLESNFHTLKGKTLPPPQFTLEPDALGLQCNECDSTLTQSHFTLKLKCTKCVYATYCPNAIREHSARRHPNSDDFLVSPTDHPQRIGGHSRLLSQLFCEECGFYSNDGNQVADHLAKCSPKGYVTEKEIVPYYPGPKRRKSRRFDPFMRRSICNLP